MKKHLTPEGHDPALALIVRLLAGHNLSPVQITLYASRHGVAIPGGLLRQFDEQPLTDIHPQSLHELPYHHPIRVYHHRVVEALCDCIDLQKEKLHTITKR